MRVLGLYNGHDASAAVVEDGKVLIALEEERLTGIKKQAGFPARALMYICKKLLCDPWDFDEVRIATPNLHAGRTNALDTKTFFEIYPQAVLVPHHEAHAALAYCWSGYDDCTVLTLDGGGEKYFGSINRCENGKMRRAYSLRKDDNEAFGMFYYYVTERLGFTPNRHEGKVMGLAARGKDIGIFNDLFWVDGPMIRTKGGREDYVVFKRFDARFPHSYLTAEDKNNIAASCQKHFEDVLLEWVRQNVKSENLAVSGGCFANVLANMKISRMVKNYYVAPPMLDDGLAIGAALTAFSPLPVRKQESMYLGIGDKPRDENRYKAADVARMIRTGLIVGLYQGRMEIGPRALGNRTILADPRNARINDILNKRLNRSEFMPFAPVILEEYANDILEDYESGKDNAPFMTNCWKVKEEWKSKIPAVVHIDGTVRPQVIKRSVNPFYYDIVNEYRAVTGIPALINTSFNAHEDPIICFNREADLAKTMGKIDVLVEGEK